MVTPCQLQTCVNGFRNVLLVVWIHDDGIKKLLGRPGQFRKYKAARHHISPIAILGNDELLGHEVHAINQRCHQTAIGPGIKCSKFINRNGSMDVHERLPHWSGEPAIYPANGLVHFLFDVLILSDLLTRWHGDEQKHRFLMIQRALLRNVFFALWALEQVAQGCANEAGIVFEGWEPFLKCILIFLLILLVLLNLLLVLGEKCVVVALLSFLIKSSIAFLHSLLSFFFYILQVSVDCRKFLRHALGIIQAFH
mmetsp:Transcript_59940/g.112839  ORF Transcript_59940/g.112839 Transcript_59940/m.112839 type:complete len:253 (-) Transcript_59940:591-1349(-)